MKLFKKKTIWLTCSISALAFACYIIHLDQRVTQRFEGQRFALPSRVYARPLTLYSGSTFSRATIEKELALLHYKRSNKSTLSFPGSYRRTSRGLEIYLREFHFWDAVRPSQKLRLVWSQRNISRIDQITSDLVDNAEGVRLDPMDIGGIYPQSIEDRQLVQLDKVPELLQKGLVAVEDREFFDHWGVSPKGIGRAFLANLKAGHIVQGGSTITQQLVKNLFLSHHQTVMRKINEAMMAILVEAHYSKKEILETYINQVYFGQNGARSFHGFELAARRLYGQSLKRLEPEQIALLVGMLKGPTYYSPRAHPKRALKRRNQVLAIFYNQNLMSKAEYAASKSRPLNVLPQAKLELSKFPDYIDLVKKQLHEFYAPEVLRKEGLRIFSNLDPSIQVAAINSAPQDIALKQATIVVDRLKGHIQALVGRHNDHGAQQAFNRALQSQRPIGSLIKPFIYLSALESGYHLASPLTDQAIEVNLSGGRVWRPENYDRKSHGVVPLYKALAFSYNQATVSLGQELGLDRVIDTLERLGHDQSLKAFPSLFLGSIDLSPLEVAGLYHSIASDGFRMPLRSIRALTTSEGKLIQHFPTKVTEVIHPKEHYQLVAAMRQVTRIGTAKALNWLLPNQSLAGKTGTSPDGRDSWFAGFGQDKLVVIWQGYDDYSPTGLTGASGSLRAFARLAKKIPLGNLKLQPPDEVIELAVDEEGQLADPACNGGTLLPFPKDQDLGEIDTCSPGNIARNIWSTVKSFFRKIN